ncbi:MAG: hypothetical protein ACRCUJ_14450 [Phocaeicola sp.]
MRINEKQAEVLDKILSLAKKSIDIVEIDFLDKDEYRVYADILERANFGESLSTGVIRINPSGWSFYKNGGFSAVYKEEMEKQEREKRSDLLTQKQIAAAKREPYLIAWGVITTITSIVLSLLKFG